MFNKIDEDEADKLLRKLFNALDEHNVGMLLEYHTCDPDEARLMCIRLYKYKTELRLADYNERHKDDPWLKRHKGARIIKKFVKDTYGN